MLKCVCVWICMFGSLWIQHFIKWWWRNNQTWTFILCLVFSHSRIKRLMCLLFVSLYQLFINFTDETYCNYLILRTFHLPPGTLLNYTCLISYFISSNPHNMTFMCSHFGLLSCATKYIQHTCLPTLISLQLNETTFFNHPFTL